MKKHYSCFSLVLIIYVFIPCFSSGQYSWKQRANFGGDARKACIGFSIGNYGYIGGGEIDVSNKRSDFWQFDPGSNSWTQKASIPLTINVANTFVINSKGYVVGGVTDPGYNTIADLWMYDPSTNTWTAKTSFPGVARYGGASFAIGNKGYYGIGNTGGRLGPYYVDFYEYNPSSDSWSKKADFPGTSRYQTYGIALNGKGYVGFGSNENTSTFFNDWWLYDPITDTWLAKTNYPGGGRSYPTGFVINNLIYVGTGNNGTCMSDFYEYNPGTDSWTQKINYGAGPRFLVSGFSIANVGYFGTGSNLIYNYNEFWEYSPSSPPVANFQLSDSFICTNSCVNFSNHSTNATSWLWFFPGAAPLASTNENPQNVCYHSSGNYDVMLIASNAAGGDTLYISKYITVNQSPPTPGIKQVGDTLFCSTDSSYVSYQWYYSNVAIPGATDTFLIAAYNGNYNVKVANRNGCSVAVGINVIIGLNEIEYNPYFSLYPNPVRSALGISVLKNIPKANIEIADVTGRKLYEGTFDSVESRNQSIDFSNFASGVYFISIIFAEGRITRKIIKEQDH